MHHVQLIMRTLKLTIAYDGTDYAGWQCQQGRPTVQETLEKAIAAVTGQKVRTLASGRTDAGVHALGQVVALRTHSALLPEVLCRAINAVLPQDVAVLEVADAPAGFHPIRDAVRKRYRYVIYDEPVRDVFKRHFVWHYCHGRLDAEAMQRAAAPLRGTHDFSSFESSGAKRKTSVRTVSDLIVERGSSVGCVERAGDGARGTGDCGAFHAPYEPGQGRGARGKFHYHRGRVERFSVQHGAGDRRHAGGSGPGQAAGKLARRSARSQRPPPSRPHRAAARARLGKGGVLRETVRLASRWL